MRTAIDARLREEARRFVFRFACDDCAHFDGGAQRCSLGYPAAPRRGALEAADGGEGGEHVELCKEYELG